MSEIRPIVEHDRIIWRDLRAAYCEDEVIASQADYILDRFLQSDAHHCLFVCVEGQPIGFITYLAHPTTYRKNDVCYIEDLFVSLLYRRQWYGKSLIEAVAARARAAKREYLYRRTDRDNSEAQKLYAWLAEPMDVMMYKLIL